MFKENQAEFHAEHYPKKASTAFTVGMWVTWDGSGAVEPVTATTTPEEFVGICKEAVSASDATNNKILISVPDDVARFECDDVDGTLTAAMVGSTYDMTDANSVNVAASVVDAVRVVKFISATKGIFRLNR